MCERVVAAALMTVITVLLAPVRPAAAIPPPIPLDVDAWSEALGAAGPELEACRRIGADAGVYGDVEVALDPDTKAWTSSASRSLGGAGARLAACVRGAIEGHFVWPRPPQRLVPRANAQDYWTFIVIGTPRIQLPAPSALLPVWRQAMTGDWRAHADLARMLPPDYTLSNEPCLRSTRASAWDAEELWLPTVGARVPPIWGALIPQVVGQEVYASVWDPAGALVTRGEHGLCLTPIDAGRQAALRAGFDAAGTCWAGGLDDVLLRPRVAFPVEKTYTQVAVQQARACAVTAGGDVVCCGPVEPRLPPAPAPMTSVALGEAFACGLERGGGARCWGAIAAPPAGTYTRLSAGARHACGLRTDGTIACWGPDATAAPKGRFVDVAAGSGGSCGLRTDGRVTCWADGGSTWQPPGRFSTVAAGPGEACGVRRDGTAVCWDRDVYPLSKPAPGRLREIVVSVVHGTCGRRDDDTVACAIRAGARPMAVAPPTDPMAQLAGGLQQICGVGRDGEVDCWGEAWPPPPPRPYAGPDPTSLALAGRVVDESGRPLAGVEVLVCSDHGPCDAVAPAARRTPGTLAALIAGMRPSWEPDGFTIATTEADGRWRASLTIHRRPPDCEECGPPGDYRWIRLVATAPGRELVERTASGSDDADLLGADLPLRTASAIDLDPRCGRARCAGTVSIETSDRGLDEGGHFERWPPGIYRPTVRVGNGLPGERIATAVIDVGWGGKPIRAAIATRPSGTGKTIRGTVSLTDDGATDVAGVEVTAACGAPATPVRRTAKSDATGAFVLRDVGPPPCVVQLSAAVGAGDVVDGTWSVTVTRLPAAGLDLRASFTRPTPYGYPR